MVIAHVEANVHLHIRKFSVINQVGAVSIDAKLDCDAFASTHSATSHYDRASFVGLAWRPGGESICCGALHAIKSNLNNRPNPKRCVATLRVQVALLTIHLTSKTLFNRLCCEINEHSIPIKFGTVHVFLDHSHEWKPYVHTRHLFLKVATLYAFKIAPEPSALSEVLPAVYFNSQYCHTIDH